MPDMPEDPDRLDGRPNYFEVHNWYECMSEEDPLPPVPGTEKGNSRLLRLRSLKGPNEYTLRITPLEDGSIRVMLHESLALSDVNSYIDGMIIDRDGTVKPDPSFTEERDPIYLWDFIMKRLPQREEALGQPNYFEVDRWKDTIAYPIDMTVPGEDPIIFYIIHLERISASSENFVRVMYRKKDGAIYLSLHRRDLFMLEGYVRFNEDKLGAILIEKEGTVTPDSDTDSMDLWRFVKRYLPEIPEFSEIHVDPGIIESQNAKVLRMTESNKDE